MVEALTKSMERISLDMRVSALVSLTYLIWDFISNFYFLFMTDIENDVHSLFMSDEKVGIVSFYGLNQFILGDLISLFVNY